MVDKKIVLNVCGVKSLGGLKLFLESFDFFVDSGSEITVLYSELPFYKDLQNQFLDSGLVNFCLLYTSPSPRDLSTSRMPSSA